MAAHSGPRTPFFALKDTTGSFWSPRVRTSLWQDTAGTIPAEVDTEVKRMDDLSGYNNHMIAPVRTRTIGDYTYTTKGPILRKTAKSVYLEFDGDGAGLESLNILGDWPTVDFDNSIGITLCVAFHTNSTQPDLPSSGFGGTWLGSASSGNYGNSWFFALRLNQEVMFYTTIRNFENTAWVNQFDDGNRYSTLNSVNYYDRPVIYIATGRINNSVLGGTDWIDRQESAKFDDVPFNNTDLLPQPFKNSLVIGARQANNDNWIAGRFYGGAMIAKEVSYQERRVIEDFLYTNCFL